MSLQHLLRANPDQMKEVGKFLMIRGDQGIDLVVRTPEQDPHDTVQIYLSVLLRLGELRRSIGAVPGMNPRRTMNHRTVMDTIPSRTMNPQELVLRDDLDPLYVDAMLQMYL